MRSPVEFARGPFAADHSRLSDIGVDARGDANERTTDRAGSERRSMSSRASRLVVRSLRLARSPEREQDAEIHAVDDAVAAQVPIE